MDCIKVGNLIKKLRKEKGMTQKQLADKMNISDKAVSKWERGYGCPDISLLRELSDILEINIERILSGNSNLDKNILDGGNMKRTIFYWCSHCNNLISSTSKAEISCCGRTLQSMEPIENRDIISKVEVVEDDFFITFNHSMEKNNYISFVATIEDSKTTIYRLYPEQNPQVRIPMGRTVKLYVGTNACALWLLEIKKEN
ncbi:MAG: helix-turn-helix domain-containing protein [Clostridiales bacterium]|nr:helix-turn-helix domain-containing protein [Clostridiales bacterium]